MIRFPIKQIEPIMSALADETADVKSMLLRYEAAVAMGPSSKHVHYGDIQDFDLALQILNDLECAMREIGQSRPAAFGGAHPISIAGLRLERIRAKLRLALGDAPSSCPQHGTRSIELF